MEPTLHSFIYTYSTLYLPRIHSLSGTETALAAASQRRALRPSGRDTNSVNKRERQQHKKTRERKREREKKVFVFLLSVLFRRTKIIKLALCKTRQKLFKLDNCAAGTVVVVRHCCSSTDRKNLWHHDDNNDDDDITNNYIVTSPTPTWSAQRQLRDSVYSKWYY